MLVFICFHVYPSIMCSFGWCIKFTSINSLHEDYVMIWIWPLSSLLEKMYCFCVENGLLWEWFYVRIVKTDWMFVWVLFPVETFSIMMMQYVVKETFGLYLWPWMSIREEKCWLEIEKEKKRSRHNCGDWLRMIDFP